MLTNPGVSDPDFPFQGTVSYNPGGDFTVGAGQSVSFTRDSGVDWDFQEQATPGYAFTSAVCTSQNGGSTFNGTAAPVGTPVTFATNVRISVDLAASDVATCTYTNERNVTDLTVLKQTLGGVGTFPVTVLSPAGATTDLSATTTEEGVPAEACTAAPVTCDVVDNPATFPADYTVAETLPAATGAGAGATAFDCNGVSQAAGTTQTVRVTTNLETLACTFTNTFTPKGSITLTKATTGGMGTTEFAVVPTAPSDDTDTADPVYSATTTRRAGRRPPPRSPATTPSTPSISALLRGRVGPDDTAGGTWSTEGITCNGTATDPTGSDVLVTLTAADPHVTCAFANAFTVTAAATTTTTSTTAGDDDHRGSRRPGRRDRCGGSGQLAMTGEDVRLPLGMAGPLAAGRRRAPRRRPGPPPPDPPAGPTRRGHRSG